MKREVVERNGANALLAGRTALDSVLQGRELAADCVAAGRLGREDRGAVIEAARFFGRLGSVRFDAAHPSGSERAATILSCLPADSSASLVGGPVAALPPDVVDTPTDDAEAAQAVGAPPDAGSGKRPVLL